MSPAALFLLVLVAAALLQLLAAQGLDSYSIVKPSTSWINSNVFFKGHDRRIISTRVQVEFELYTDARFYCVSSISPCDEFLFALSIGNIDTEQIVWSANQDHPVREDATLEFTGDGNLVLFDVDGSHVWSSNSAGRSVAGMQITNIGNLVLFDHRNATVWQSFEHPTNTMVPGQSLAEGMRLTATTSAASMYISVLRDGLAAYAESTPPQLYFRYYPQIGNSFVGNDPTNVTFTDGMLNFMFGSHSNNSVALPEAKSIQYMRLDSDGYLRLYEWSWDLESWTMVYDILGSLGMSACAYPTVCGEYGVCTGGQCTCPLEINSSSSYFKPVNERKPNLGCTTLSPVSCQEIQHHQLLTIPNIFYYDNYTIMNSKSNKRTSIDQCKQDCLKNCSCMAVLFKGGECVWVSKVFSMQSIQDETIGYESSAYIKVQLSPSNENKRKVQLNSKKKVMLGATLGTVTTLVLLVIVVTLYVQTRRKYEEKDEFDFDQFPGMPTRYSFEKLSECTEGFGMKLGEGGFGSVFKGKLGEERVAMKRLEGARQGKKEFLAEVETIGSIEHINLVKLVGFCAEKSERLLVYEYMPRGSLDRWIYCRHNKAPLDWFIRCRIILDIAKGLCYLHEECRRKIAHLDIKPQNVLLDDKFNAKVADFGLCKLINRDQSKVVTMMRGTPGYLAPEWLTSWITEKMDVYSFGVVIMEIISGRKNIDNSQPEENVELIKLLREKAQNNQLIDLIDNHSDDMVSHQEEVVQMMKLAIGCLQHDSTQRPSMSTVIKVLEGVISVENFDANSLMLFKIIRQHIQFHLKHPYYLAQGETYG